MFLKEYCMFQDFYYHALYFLLMPHDEAQQWAEDQMKEFYSDTPLTESVDV